MTARIYVGVKHDGSREVFRNAVEPTYAMYGKQYNYVIGAFKTVRGANFLAKRGQSVPGQYYSALNVVNAERLAKKAALTS